MTGAIDRRAVLAAAAAALAAPARAQTADARLFGAGSLAQNPLARSFSPATVALSGDPVMLSAAGPKRWRDLAGKPHLVSLWAEWCAPCLAEAADLAALSVKYRERGVGVVAILTGSHDKLDLHQAQAMMARVGARDLPLWVEPGGGAQLLKTFASHGEGSSLPCNLLVDEEAVVRARAFGRVVVMTSAASSRARSADAASRPLTDQDKRRLLDHPEPSIWTTPFAAQLMDALAAGALKPA